MGPGRRRGENSLRKHKFEPSIRDITNFPPAGRPSAGAHGPGPMGPSKISQARSPRQGVLGKVSYACIGEKYAALAKNIQHWRTNMQHWQTICSIGETYSALAENMLDWRNIWNSQATTTATAAAAEFPQSIQVPYSTHPGKTYPVRTIPRSDIHRQPTPPVNKTGGLIKAPPAGLINGVPKFV